jgi:hypothetical protein
MNKKMLALSISMALFAAVGYAKGEKVVSLDQGHAIVENQFPSGYNHQARIDVDGFDVFIDGSFIYWQAMEGGLELGVKYKDPEEILKIFSSNINIDFKYKPGFKVGIGTSLHHDNWLLSAEYTRLHLKNIKRILPDDLSDGYYISTSWTRDPERFYYSLAEWQLKYDVVDLEMSRPYYLGSCLVLKPFASLRGGVIKQYYDIKFSVDYPSTTLWVVDVEQKSWLVGPRAGIDCDWIFFDYFRFISNIAFSMCYQHIAIKGYNAKYENGDLDDPFWNADNRENQLVPNAEGALGLSWGSYFGNNNRWHFSLSALYEVHYFFDQNKILATSLGQLTTGAVAIIFPAYNLMMHGLTLTARFDF